MRATSLIPLGLLCAAVAMAARADETDDLETSPLAAAFGAAPLIWGARLSPEGERVSMIQMHPSGVSVARILDIAAGTTTALVSGSDEANRRGEVLWCGWANETRLICGARIYSGSSILSRMVAVDSDGGDVEWFNAGRLIDYLPDDPNRVLVASGHRFRHLNVYNGAITDEGAGPLQIVGWMTDGQGRPRVYRRFFGTDSWHVREVPGGDWSLLHEKAYTDTEDTFAPVGFGERNELLVFDGHEGRRALFALDLDESRSRRLVFAHQSLDVDALQLLGKYRRAVAVSYIDDRQRLEFLDARIEQLHTELQAEFVGKTVSILDEDWNRRYYLILVDGADDPGTYYRFDSERHRLLRLLPAYPSLAGRELAPVQAISYPARDGTLIPGYLTMPKDAAYELPRAVVLPHDGPASRDYLKFDFLAQYLAAKGYAVLQSNYRGSAGYGDAWAGQGGFRDWRRAVDDIAAGTEYLAREGIADRKRICAVGWGYGGYAALMSVIEHADLYRCVVSIAGVTDPRSHGAAALNYLGGQIERSFIGTDDDVLEAGSPLERAAEIDVPALLFHGRYDWEVRPQQSDDLAKTLQRAGKDAELVEYEYAEHDFRDERSRIDLLTRLAVFLDAHLSK